LLRGQTFRVNRNHLEIGAIAELHQVIVGSHGFVEAASGNFNTKFRANIINTLFKRCGGDYQMVESIHTINLF
jgi:hypothetical protein